MTESPEHAAFRTDLVASRQETPEGPRFVFKDPRTGRYFKLREEEYAVARRLDGATPLETIAHEASAELGGEVTAEALRPFVEQLRGKGLLEGTSAAQAPVERFVRGTPLYLRFRAFNPDRLLTFLEPRVRFFFTPYFVAGAGALIVWAVLTTYTENQAIMRGLSELWSFQSLFLAWVTVLGVTTLHEFAHGLTCKHFGGQVSEMGFMLIYFQPAFYCNISDAWLFPKKSHRLWVTAAGGFFELFVWAMATLVWTVVEPGTWVSGLALVIIATSAVKQFFNINPLIKLDGYYLLSDLLDVPNLRERAGAFVTNGTRRLLGLGIAGEQVEASPRERKIFAAYGVLAIAFSYWFLAVIVLGFGDYLTAQYQGWGFAAFTVFVGLIFPQPIQRLLRRFRTSPSPSAPTGVPKRLRLSGRAKLFIAATGLVALAYFVPLELRVGGPFELLPARNADTRATVAGVVERIYVEEGDRVAAGDTIARLSARDYGARFRMASAELGENQAQLRLLRAGPRKEEVSLARVAVAKAEEQLRFVKAELDRFRGLAAIQVTSRADLDRAEQEVSIATKEVEQERARLAALLAGSRPDEIAAMEQEVARSAAELERLNEQLDQLVITAPHAGVITTPRMSEKLGAYLEPGALIAEVHSLDRVTAVISVSERDIGEVQPGQRATLRLRAYPGRTFEGSVTRIAPTAVDSSSQGERSVRVEVDLPNRDGVLRPRMTGHARVYAGKRRALDIVTRRLTRFIKVDFWSWW